MKIAILTDAHGNLPALDAALDAIRTERCAAIYHTGDAVGIGPFPAECVERLLATPGTHMVMGNHEAYCTDYLPHEQALGMSAEEAVHCQWVHAQLTPMLRAAISHWPWSLDAEINGLRLAFAHYALDDTGHGFIPLMQRPTAAALDAAFAQLEADFVFYGHDHASWDAQGRARYINPGSLGCFDRPIARFVILEIDDDGAHTVTKHAVAYDDSALLQAFDLRDVPARDFIRRTFLER